MVSNRYEGCSSRGVDEVGRKERLPTKNLASISYHNGILSRIV